MQAKNILVTGGTRGIGHGIVRGLLSIGCNVGFCGRKSQEEQQELVENLRKEFPNVKVNYYQCDISSIAGQEALLDDFEKDFTTIDGLINNAGVAPLVRADILEMSPESFQRVLGINLEGPFFLTQRVAKRMIENKTENFRCIINIGSVSADYASISRGEYCISKAGIAMATKLWAVRLADENIPVYEIRPGIIKSDMTSTVTAKYDKLIADGLTLQRRWGMPEDIAKAVNTLVTGSLSYSTGSVINVDGGLTIERF